MPSNWWDNLFPRAGGGGAPAAPAPAGSGPIPGLQADIAVTKDPTRRGIKEGVQGMLDEDFRLADIEDQRLGAARNFIMGQFNALQNSSAEVQRALNRGLFSEASTQSGLMARDAMANLNRSLGARGLGTDSGVALGLASRIEQSRVAQNDASTRAIGRDYALRADQRAAQQFNAALGVTGVLSQGDSMLRSDSIRDALNALIGIEGIETQAATAKDAAKAAKKGGILSGIGSIAGALIGGI